MVEDHSIAEAKLLLRYGERRSKAKSWLTAALGSDPRDGDRNEDGNDIGNTADRTGEDDLAAQICVNDELSGIGVVKKTDDSDAGANDRQLLTANEALRRRLLSRDGLKRYHERQRHGPVNSKPPTTSTKRRKVESDDEDEVEAKGRAKVATTNKSLSASHKSTGVDEGNQSRRRAGRYLDEILAGRQKGRSRTDRPEKR